MKTRSFRVKSQAREKPQSGYGDQRSGNAAIFGKHHVVGPAGRRGRHQIREKPLRFEMLLHLSRQSRKGFAGTDKQKVECAGGICQNGKRCHRDIADRGNGPGMQALRRDDNRTFETLSFEAKAAVSIGIDRRLSRKAWLHARWATAHAFAPDFPSAVLPVVLPDQSRDTPTARMTGAAMKIDE